MTLEMNPEIRARWVAALRSGKYPQTDAHLRDRDGLCCLGVLCEIAAEDGVVTLEDPREGSSVFTYGGNGSLLPKPVIDWAGLTHESPTVIAEPASYGEAGPVELITLNDDEQWTFEQIADVIEGATS